MEPVNQSDIYAMLIRGEAFNWLKPFYSESNSFLEIQQVEDTLPCGEDLEVWVDYILDRKELDPEAAHVDFQYLVSMIHWGMGGGGGGNHTGCCSGCGDLASAFHRLCCCSSFACFESH